MEKIYYAHSILKYGSNEEKIEIEQIKQAFPGYEIINPGNLTYDGKGLEMFFSTIKECSLLVFSEYQGFIGKGVYEEILFAKKNCIPIFLLRKEIIKEQDGLIFRIWNEYDWKNKYAYCVTEEEYANIQNERRKEKNEKNTSNAN